MIPPRIHTRGRARSSLPASAASRRLARRLSRVSRLVKGALVPLVRAYARRVPRGVGVHFLLRQFFWCPRDFVVRTVFGPKIAGNTRDILQRHIYYFGVWEPNLTYWIRSRLKPGDTFVDAGANIGYFSLLASSLVGDSGRVVAIEASPSILDLLRANLALNRIQNVRTEHRALMESPGTVTVYKGPPNNIGQTRVISATTEWPAEGEVRAEPLSTLLQPSELLTLRMIKIDVEGAELRAVRGLIPLLPRRQSDLEVIVEVSPQRLARQGGSADEIIEIFRAHGLYPYALNNDYTLEGYLHHVAPAAPKRLRHSLHEETDLVFSPIDAEYL